MTARPGDAVSFSATASGVPAPGIQWQVKAPGDSAFSNIPGANSGTYSFTAQRSDSGKLYRALFSNGYAPNALTIAVGLSVTGATSNDLDGDGRSDPLVWRGSTGESLWAGSSSLSSTSAPVQFGSQALGDKVLSGDIDGDGVIDLVVWRPSDGTWYWLTSSTSYATGSHGQKQWGNQALGDVPLLADMDADGRSNMVLWRGSTGTWFWLTSSSGYNYASFGTKQWGNSAFGDIPLVGDFDGDRRADLAVWRSANGWWYWLTSTTATNTAPPGSGNGAMLSSATSRSSGTSTAIASPISWSGVRPRGLGSG